MSYCCKSTTSFRLRLPTLLLLLCLTLSVCTAFRHQDPFFWIKHNSNNNNNNAYSRSFTPFLTPPRIYSPLSRGVTPPRLYERWQQQGSPGSVSSQFLPWTSLNWPSVTASRIVPTRRSPKVRLSASTVAQQPFSPWGGKRRSPGFFASRRSAGNGYFSPWKGKRGSAMSTMSTVSWDRGGNHGGSLVWRNGRRRRGRNRRKNQRMNHHVHQLRETGFHAAPWNMDSADISSDHRQQPRANFHDSSPPFFFNGIPSFSPLLSGTQTLFEKSFLFKHSPRKRSSEMIYEKNRGEPSSEQGLPRHLERVKASTLPRLTHFFDRCKPE